MNRVIKKIVCRECDLNTDDCDQEQFLPFYLLNSFINLVEKYWKWFNVNKKVEYLYTKKYYRVKSWWQDHSSWCLFHSLFSLAQIFLTTFPEHHVPPLYTQHIRFVNWIIYMIKIIVWTFSLQRICSPTRHQCRIFSPLDDIY